MARKSNPTDDDQQAEAGDSQQIGKGRPTPTRKEAQAAKAQPLVGSRDRAAMKAQRAKQAEARERARVGMMRGDERFLGPRDKGPQRKFIRDYVDARFSVGEFLIPLMIIVLLLMFIPGDIQVYSVFIVWGVVILAVIDAIILGLRLKKKLAQKFGAEHVQSGFRWYAAMRAFQFRMLRVPKPQVKRFQFPE